MNLVTRRFLLQLVLWVCQVALRHPLEVNYPKGKYNFKAKQCNAEDIISQFNVWQWSAFFFIKHEQLFDVMTQLKSKN